jgi:hypothetical protein
MLRRMRARESGFSAGQTGLIDGAMLMLGYGVEVMPRVAVQGFQVLPKRWIVERRFATDYGYHPRTSEAMLYAAFSTLMLRRLRPLQTSSEKPACNIICNKISHMM